MDFRRRDGFLKIERLGDPYAVAGVVRAAASTELGACPLPSFPQQERMNCAGVPDKSPPPGFDRPPCLHEVARIR
jgi:hypothetical protein